MINCDCCGTEIKLLDILLQPITSSTVAETAFTRTDSINSLDDVPEGLYDRQTTSTASKRRSDGYLDVAPQSSNTDEPVYTLSVSEQISTILKHLKKSVLPRRALLRNFITHYLAEPEKQYRCKWLGAEGLYGSIDHAAPENYQYLEMKFVNLPTPPNYALANFVPTYLVPSTDPHYDQGAAAQPLYGVSPFYALGSAPSTYQANPLLQATNASTYEVPVIQYDGRLTVLACGHTYHFSCFLKNSTNCQCPRPDCKSVSTSLQNQALVFSEVEPAEVKQMVGAIAATTSTTHAISVRQTGRRGRLVWIIITLLAGCGVAAYFISRLFSSSDSSSPTPSMNSTIDDSYSLLLQAYNFLRWLLNNAIPELNQSNLPTFAEIILETLNATNQSGWTNCTTTLQNGLQRLTVLNFSVASITALSNLILNCKINVTNSSESSTSPVFTSTTSTPSTLPVTVTSNTTQTSSTTTAPTTSTTPPSTSSSFLSTLSSWASSVWPTSPATSTTSSTTTASPTTTSTSTNTSLIDTTMATSASQALTTLSTTSLSTTTSGSSSQTSTVLATTGGTTAALTTLAQTTTALSTLLPTTITTTSTTSSSASTTTHPTTTTSSSTTTTFTTTSTSITTTTTTVTTTTMLTSTVTTTTTTTTTTKTTLTTTTQRATRPGNTLPSTLPNRRRDVATIPQLITQTALNIAAQANQTMSEVIYTFNLITTPNAASVRLWSSMKLQDFWYAGTGVESHVINQELMFNLTGYVVTQFELNTNFGQKPVNAYLIRNVTRYTMAYLNEHQSALANAWVNLSLTNISYPVNPMSRYLYANLRGKTVVTVTQCLSTLMRWFFRALY